MSRRLPSRTEPLSRLTFVFQVLEAVAQGCDTAFRNKFHERRKRRLAEFRGATEGNFILTKQLDREQTSSIFRQMRIVEFGGFQQRCRQFKMVRLHAPNVPQEGELVMQFFGYSRGHLGCLTKRSVMTTPPPPSIDR